MSGSTGPPETLNCSELTRRRKVLGARRGARRGAMAQQPQDTLISSAVRPRKRKGEDFRALSLKRVRELPWMLAEWAIFRAFCRASHTKRIYVEQSASDGALQTSGSSCPRRGQRARRPTRSASFCRMSRVSATFCVYSQPVTSGTCRQSQRSLYASWATPRQVALLSSNPRAPRDSSLRGYCNQRTEDRRSGRQSCQGFPPPASLRV